MTNNDNPQNNRNGREGHIKVKRVKYDSLCLYEVTEDELDTLKEGSPNSIYLNFSIFLLTIAIAFTVTLVTIKIDSNRVFNCLLIVTIIGYLGGIFLLILWYRTRKSMKRIIDKIKSRLPVEKE